MARLAGERRQRLQQRRHQEIVARDPPSLCGAGERCMPCSVHADRCDPVVRIVRAGSAAVAIAGSWRPSRETGRPCSMAEALQEQAPVGRG
jgi:hypothetical protein